MNLDDNVKKSKIKKQTVDHHKRESKNSKMSTHKEGTGINSHCFPVMSFFLVLGYLR